MAMVSCMLSEACHDGYEFMPLEVTHKDSKVTRHVTGNMESFRYDAGGIRDRIAVVCQLMKT